MDVQTMLSLAGFVGVVLVNAITVTTAMHRASQNIVAQVHGVELRTNDKIAAHAERLAILEATKDFPCVGQVQRP